ncbi:MAG: oligoendopeptidase F, partial [Spirochaetales bacterium]|nr:oligoendopeptidase F [Spirochaetales bacterium]
MSTTNNDKNTSGIPSRADVPACDKWDLTSLYKTDADWESDILRINELADKVAAYQGRIKSNADDMLAAIKLNEELEQISERAGNYAFLQTASDASNADFQDKEGRYMMAAVEAESKTCFVVTEIQEIPDDEMARRLERADYAEYKIMLKKLLHNKPHILSEKEERLFALMSESQQTPHNTFSM